jgi:NAD(P)-dependent dehydrogenase (short-subunit alcohol dehydrogenase family)
MSSIQDQFPNFTARHARYPAIDPARDLSGSASGKVVFLTGASQGIGQATAAAFAQAGAKAVYITARTEVPLRETKNKVIAANPNTRCEYEICDVTKEADIRAAVEKCLEVFGHIDVADANAGYLDKWRKIGESDPESWWRTWEVNVRGAYHVIRHTAPHLIAAAKERAKSGGSSGHLILISSVGGQLLTPGASDYQTSKHAINRLCEFVNLDHGEEGLKCFAVHPGGVATALAKNMPTTMHAHLVDPPELAAGFIVWLSSGQADWARGRYLSCNWDVEEIADQSERIIQDDLLVNRLRIKA